MAFFISPLNIIVFLIVLAIFFKKRRKLLLWTTFGLFLFFSNTMIFRGVIKHWESAPTALPVNDSSLINVVVLGGMASYYEPAERVRFWQSGDRLMQALAIVYQNPVAHVVFSGGSAAVLLHERPEGAFISEFLTHWDVSKQVEIQVDSLSRNTFENALYTSRIFERNGWDKKIALVTSAWHMKRAQWCFNQFGFEVTPIGADPMYPLQKAVPADYFMPSAQIIINWQILIKEWVGWLAYKVRY